MAWPTDRQKALSVSNFLRISELETQNRETLGTMVSRSGSRTPDL